VDRHVVEWVCGCGLQQHPPIGNQVRHSLDIESDSGVSGDDGLVCELLVARLERAEDAAGCQHDR